MAREFLSTLSLRRATQVYLRLKLVSWNFYPRSPCGERLPHPLELIIIHEISIHALLAESDPRCKRLLHSTAIFLSTLSLRRATNHFQRPGQHQADFYPRSPCGERRGDAWYIMRKCAISIHALLAESDQLPSMACPSLTDFYPRSPCGERRCNNGCGC